MWGCSVGVKMRERETDCSSTMGSIFHRTGEKRRGITYIGSTIAEKKTAELNQSPAYIPLHNSCYNQTPPPPAMGPGSNSN